MSSRHLATTVRSEVRPGPQAGRGSYPDDPDKAAQLKGVAEKMDAFFASSDGSAFDAVADSNITLHGDLLILDRDISGADTVKKTLQTYTDSYDYKHVDVAHGADIDGSSIFHFWLHQVCVRFAVFCTCAAGAMHQDGKMHCIAECIKLCICILPAECPALCVWRSWLCVWWLCL